MRAKLTADGDLPVLRKDAFARAVGLGREGNRGCLARVSLNNLGDILESHGDEATDGALRHLAGVLAGHIRDTDTVGRVGTGTFGIVLAYADEDGAAAKMARLIAKVEERPFIWKGTDIPLILSHTIAPIDPPTAE